MRERKYMNIVPYGEVITEKMEEILSDPDVGVLLTPWLGRMLRRMYNGDKLSCSQVDRLNKVCEPYSKGIQNPDLTPEQKQVLRDGEQEVEQIEKSLELYEGVSRVLKGDYR